MKKIFLALMAVAGLATCAQAQTTYNMNVRLNDGTVVTYAADDVAEVTFDEAEQPYNILTEEFIPDAVLRDYIKTNIANGEDVYTNIQAAAYNGVININHCGCLTSRAWSFSPTCRNSTARESTSKPSTSAH